MEFNAQIYAKDGSDFVLLDLFKDEKIELKSSVQDISDISEVFTDFSKDFTIPASKTNNGVFKHYYNNDLDQFNANVRIDGIIEINGTPFRKGKIQLESAEVKNNQVESYKVSFYGDNVSLKDKFGDDKLKDLNYATIATAYSGSTVENSITDTADLDVRFPLISSERVWTYADGASTDITQVGTPLAWTELFPAVKDKSIFDIIEFQYGVQFVGNFLTDKRFTNSFTWWKNRQNAAFFSQPFDLTFDFTSIADNTKATYEHLNEPNEINIVGFDINSEYSSFITDFITGQYLNIKIKVDNLSNSSPFFIDVYKNGALFNSFEQLVDGSYVTVVNEFLVISNAFQSLDDVYEFKVRTTGAATFDYDIQYNFGFDDVEINTPNPNVITAQPAGGESYTFSSTSGTTSSNFDFNTTAPDISVLDWFKGTLKQFNLTCYPTANDNEYQIEPLQDYYQGGEEVIITPHVITDSIEVSRPPLYNEIVFSWEESKSFLNKDFREAYERQYGGLRETFPDYDGGKYEVKLPFETLLFNNVDTTNGNLMLGYSLTESPDYKPYIPKPVKLYLGEQLTPVYFFFDDGTGGTLKNDYMPFGSEVTHNSIRYASNFGQEQSVLDLAPLENSLYRTYYQPYLVNLFNSKTRVIKLKAKLPMSMLTRLTLDDAIIVRDKKYRINDMTTDLTTGDVQLVLISDFIVERSRYLVNGIPSGVGDIVIPIKPPKGGTISIESVSIKTFSTSSITLPATGEGEQNWTLTQPENTDGAARQEEYLLTGVNSDGSTAYEQTIIIEQAT